MKPHDQDSNKQIVPQHDEKVAIVSWSANGREPVIRSGRFLTDTELVKELDRLGFPHTKGTLKNWRHLGKGGPRFYKIGNKVAYDPTDIAEWIRNCKFGPGNKRDPRPLTAITTAAAANEREADAATSQPTV